MMWVSVFIGGGLGSMARFLIAKTMEQYGWNFAWATLLANLLSSIILGGLIGWSVRSGYEDNWRLFWMVGFCGGFSTFSTFTAETFAFLEQGQWNYAILNILTSVLICLIGLFLGMKVMS